MKEVLTAFDWRPAYVARTGDSGKFWQVATEMDKILLALSILYKNVQVLPLLFALQLFLHPPPTTDSPFSVQSVVVVDLTPSKRVKQDQRESVTL